MFSTVSLYAFLSILSGVVLAKGPLPHSLLEEYPLTLETWNPLDKKGDQFKAQSESDVIIALHTLFPMKEGAQRVNQEERFEEAEQKAAILARFLMMLKNSHFNLLTETQKKLASKGTPWPYPMAMVVGHGQRVLITVPGVAAKKVLSWLFTGNASIDKFPSFVKKRAISSHGVTKKNGHFEELKMGNVVGAVRNIFKGATGHHLYVNMPWGGLGEIGPDGLLNDVSGKRYDPVMKKRDDRTKLGHFYVYWDEIDGTAVLLIGVETCSPGSKNPYGVSHSIKSGMSDLSKNRSVNGGSKWKSLLGDDEAPAAYGGMRAEFNTKTFEELQRGWKEYEGWNNRDKALYMVNLLSGNG